MKSTRTFMGIDGCRAGWFCVTLGEGDTGSFCVVPDARAVGAMATKADSVLIDIPIGLPATGSDGRTCDREARQRLGRARASSVFSAPARHTLVAASYTEALNLNRQATGRGLSKQAWNIVPKIREVDSLLSNNRSLQDVLYECHPELCFWALNGKRAMQYNKKTGEGRQERIHVLQHYLSGCQSFFEQARDDFPRREVACDDIIDAMVCAITARLGHGAYQTLPVDPPTDEQGLPMRIAYYLPVS
jgi:predicted RNase H-like nuclease